MSKIFLSPSDQTNNAYSGVATNESSQCVKIANSAKKYLEINGYTVKVGSVSRGYVGRVTDSNNWGADLHVPIHTNAGGGDGTLVMCYPGNTNNKYVKAIYNNVASISPGKDDGIKTNVGLYEITNTKAVCVYVECEFHDNSTLAKWIANNTDAIGKSIAKGICQADGKTFKESTSSSGTTTSGSLYKVQCGAFASKPNAESLALKLNRSGFTTYIYLDYDGLYKVQCGAYSKKANAENQVKLLKSKGFNTYLYKE